MLNPVSTKSTTANSMKIASKYKKVLTSQDYSPTLRIHGVELIELKIFPGEDGDFLELGRVDKKGFLLEAADFKVAQISQSRMLPGSIKAWHLHLRQTDLWFVHPHHQLLVGLLDLRQGSKTFEAKMRFVMGAGRARLLKIPPGIGHGAANLTQQEQFLTYFTDRHFDPQNPDEHRLPFDLLGADFWRMQPG